MPNRRPRRKELLQNPMPETLVAVDIGSSSLKAAAIARTGEVLARSRQPLLLRASDKAAGEWKSSLRKALEDLASQQDDLSLCALCISGNGPTLVGGEGETLLWNAPVSAVPTGGLSQAEKDSLFISRIREFKHRYPESWSKGPFIYSGPEYLIHQLTGADLTILPEERYEKAYWSKAALLDSGFTELEANKLPPFVVPGTKAGILQEDISPLAKKGLPVYCGAPDFVSALVGTDCLSPGLLCDRAGSSEGINFCSDVPLQGDGIRTLPSVIPGLWNASFLLPESGSRFSEFKSRVEQEYAAPIDFNQLVFFCINNPARDPLFDQGKYLMLQTAMQVRDSLKILLAQAAEQGQKIPSRMTVTGGQAANDEWNQMKANVTGLTILVPECSDAELLGDAVFAFTGMGLFSSIQEASHCLHSIAKSFEPEDF